MSVADIAQILENTILSTDVNVRVQSETQLTKLANENFLQFAGLLSQVLADEQIRIEARILAALALKNELTAKDSTKKQQYAHRWMNVDPAARNEIKNNSLIALGSQEDRVANGAAQLVASIALIEIQRNEWTELMKLMVDNTAQDKTEKIKRASLLTIGYICEGADPSDESLYAHANNILISIVQGAQSSEPSKVVRLTALNALADSLAFIKHNMERDGERNYLMQVVCEATQAGDSEIQASAFGCLCMIMTLYYYYMKPYMEQALYGLTIANMQSPDEKVASMAVEFWSSVCEEEIDIAYEKETYPHSTLQSYNFAVVAIPEVIPNLLTLLTKQNEDSEDDDWNVSMSAGSCLQLFAQNCGNYVVEPVLKFVEANITSANWREREAAVMAFGSILDGPDKVQLKTLVRQALPPILQLIADPVLQVKETVAWCMGRIADLVVGSIDSNEMLPNVIQACLLGLQDHPKVVTNCCWTIINLVEQLAGGYSIYQFYPNLVSELIKAASRPDNEHSARASAFEALSSLIEFASDEVAPIVSQISSFVLERLSQTVQVDINTLSGEDKQNLEELQSNILGVLATAIRRNPESTAQVSDMLMELFLKLLSKQSSIDEDIFYAISALVSSLGPEFQKYLPSFSQYLLNALNQVSSPIAITAVGLIADICNALDVSFKEFAPSFMDVLGQMISTDAASKELKPAVLSVFGDIASSIGADFIPYLKQVMGLCVTAQHLKPEGSMENIEYVLKVHESVLDAYVGIVAGLHDQPEALYSYVGAIFQFLISVAESDQFSTEDSVCRAAVGLIGDISAIFPGGQIKQFYQQEWVTEFIKKTRANPQFSAQTKDTARWAREQQKIQVSL